MLKKKKQDSCDFLQTQETRTSWGTRLGGCRGRHPGILEGGLATEREAEELQGHKSGLSIHSSRGREPREQRALPEPALPCPSFWKTVQEGGGGIPPSWLL